MAKQITARKAFAAGVFLKDISKVLHSCGHLRTYQRYIGRVEEAEMKETVCPKCAKAAKKAAKEVTPAAETIEQEAELEQAKRPGRPRKGESKKQNISIALSPDVLNALEKVTLNSSQFIEDWLRQNPRIEQALNYS